MFEVTDEMLSTEFSEFVDAHYPQGISGELASEIHEVFNSAFLRGLAAGYAPMPMDLGDDERLCEY